MIAPKKIVETLNDLIETCKDGQEGFRTASEGVEDSELKSIFSRYSLERSKFAGELQIEANTLGEKTPENSSSLAGALHRGWINIKASVTSRDVHAVLEECERGEDVAVAAYRDALELELPSNIREVIERQSASIQEAHDTIRDLRDRSRK